MSCKTFELISILLYYFAKALSTSYPLDLTSDSFSLNLHGNLVVFKQIRYKYEIVLFYAWVETLLNNNFYSHLVALLS